MGTFREVEDSLLVEMIGTAKYRIVFIAPGVHAPIAKALGERFDEVDSIDINVIIDPDEDVCRIGYGDVDGLRILGECAKKKGFTLMRQPGLRIGVLLSDGETLVWAPTPRSVEAGPSDTKDMPDSDGASQGFAPNGLLLGDSPGAQLADAVAANGTDTLPSDAEVGSSAVTPEQIKRTLQELADNPPVPVDLARVTRVFSSKLQFVEFTVTQFRISSSQLTVAGNRLNSDVKGDLRQLLDARLRAFGDLRDERIEVRAFVNGVEAQDKDGNPITERLSEAMLERKRAELEACYTYPIAGYGRLIIKAERKEFVKMVEAFRQQLEAYSEGIRARIEEMADKIIDDVTNLVIERSKRGGMSLNRDLIAEEIRLGLARAQQKKPKVSVVFKDVTYEQTQNDDFFEKVYRAIPAAKRAQLGKWTHQFDAVRSRSSPPDLWKGGI